MPSDLSNEMATETDTALPNARNAGGRRVWFRQARAFAERYLRVLARNRAVVFWGVAFPAGFYLLTLALFIDFGPIPERFVGDVKAVTAIGYGTFGALIVCLNAFSAHLVEDIETQRYEQFRAMAIAPTADLAGRMVAGYLFMLASVLAVLLVGAAAGADYALRSLASVPILLLTLAGFALLWMLVATAVAILVRDARFTNIVAVSVALVSYWVTGFNGTVVEMFAGPDAALNVLPNTLATRVLVYHLVGIGDWAAAGMAPPAVPSGLDSLALLAGYGLVSLGLAVVVVRGLVYDRGVLA